MGEEDLGVGHGLVREEYDEGWTLLVQDGAEGEVDLGKAWRAAVERVVEEDVYNKYQDSAHDMHGEVSSLRDGGGREGK